MTLMPVQFLLVDDLQENLLSLEALLKRDGLTMLKARSGEEALELLLKNDVALALLDVQMPGMDGFELAELIRGRSQTKNIPIIFLTAGNEDRQRRFRGYEAGAVDFLHKPIEPHILRSKASVFFDLYRHKQRLEIKRDALEAKSSENAKLLEESQKYVRALAEADKRKDEFLATLAHELRNPLAPIRNGVQLLRKSPDPQKSENILSMMDSQLSHLIRLIDDLMDVARISQGKINLNKEKINLQDIIETSIEFTKPMIEKKNHTLVLDMPEKPIQVYVDQTRVVQIISNILNNAAKYSPDKGEINIVVQQDGHEFVIEITDKGIGIEQDMLPKVFDVFTQVDFKAENSEGGLGIGLALVKRLIELHEGSIEVFSAGLNEGSSFTIRLPVSAEGEADAIEKVPIQQDIQDIAIKPDCLNILVVDDNVQAAQTTGWMMEALGHEYKLAHTGSDALKIAETMKPDIILLDIGLPDIDGYTVCRTLKKDPSFQNTLIIAQTGWGQNKDKLEAQEAGFDDHLVKPVSMDDFSRVLSMKNNK